MKNFNFIALLLIIITCSGFPQKLEWVNYTNSETVYRILNHKDNLWIATNGGLARLNKSSEEIFVFTRSNASLPDNHINSLCLDSSGNLWVGTRYSGIGKFTGNNCTVYNSKNSGLPMNQANAALASDGERNLYIGSLIYFSCYDGNNWKSKTTGNILSAFILINTIFIDNEKSIWLGATWGLGKYEKDSVIEGYAKIKDNILSIAQDKTNSLWLATHGSGLIKFDGVNKTVFNTSNSAIPSDVIYNLKFDSRGNLWMGTSAGLAMFDGSGFITYNVSNSGISENIAFAVEVDENGIVWVGTQNKGLCKFDGKTWKRFKLSNSVLPSNSISDIKTDKKNNTWITTNGLLKYNRKKWTLFDSTNSPINSIGDSPRYIFSAEVDKKDNIWIGLPGTPWLYKFDGIQWQAFDSTNSPVKKIYSSFIKSDKVNNLWISAGYLNGLLKYDGNNWTTYSTKNTPLTSDCLLPLAFDKNDNLWVGMRFYFFFGSTGETITAEGGLAKFDGSDWQIYNAENSQLPINNVGAIAVDSNNVVWLSTWDKQAMGIDLGGGLTRFDGKTWKTYNIYNSPLTSNTIFNITVDKDNNLWLATQSGGLVKFDGVSKWQVYNQENSGIAFNAMNVVTIDDFGNKWIGHNESGISVFNEKGIDLTSINTQNNNIIPQTLTLEQNYPNPFNASTIINYSLPVKAKVVVKIFDMLGKEIAILKNDEEAAGSHSVNFNAVNLSSGIYFIKLYSNGFFIIKKCILLK